MNMRDLMRIVSEGASLQSLPRRVLKRGTILYHGTNSAGDFSIPDGPAWFAFTQKEGRNWAGWASPPDGRSLGDKRVLAVEVIEDVELLDTSKVETWENLCELVVGDPEAGTRTVAEELVGQVAGWFGRKEIMLTDPEKRLRPVTGLSQIVESDTNVDFASWFDGSTVVDQQGQPLVVYHGTKAQFDTFDNDLANDGAHFFTTDRTLAAHFGTPGAYYVSIKNPLIITQEDLEDRVTDDDVDDGILPRDYIGEFIEEAKAQGHDGLIIREFADHNIESDIFMPFAPDQILRAQ